MEEILDLSPKKHLTDFLVLLFIACCCVFITYEKIRLNRLEYVQQSLELYYAGNYSQALPRLKEFLVLKQDIPDINLMIADCLEETGHYREAVIKYKTALSVETGTAFDYLNYGEALKQVKLRQDARIQWGTALQAISKLVIELYSGIQIVVP